MNNDKWAQYFNSSVRRAGERLLTENKISFSQPSSSEVVAYIKATSSYKVSLKKNDLDNTALFTNCNCPAFQKKQNCKHIWSVFLAVLEKSPDFLEEIKTIEKSTSLSSVVAKKIQTESQIKFNEAAKIKQADYRKQQYQKQKLLKKSTKNKMSKFKQEPTYPADIVAALDYFSKNGFPLNDNLDKSCVLLARKKLSRIFHPDVGGSHSEIVELNEQSEVLLDFLNK